MRKLELIGLLMGYLFTQSVAFACQGGTCANGLAYKAFGVMQGADKPILAVFVHGDVSRGGPADYMYSYAQKFAGLRKNVVAVALLRPGYYDRAGKKSDGSNNRRRDTFYARNNRAIAGAIRELKNRYNARKVVAMGHSGGAGAIGVIAGTNPGLLNGIVLVTCPCDVRAWNLSRGRNRRSSSQSPVDFVGRIAPGTSIVAVTGSADKNTRPKLALDYVAKAQAVGLSAQIRIVGGGHGFRKISSPAIDALGEMAR